MRVQSLILVLLASTSSARGQSPDPEEALAPPSVLSLPDVVLSPEARAEVDHLAHREVTVRVLVDVHGRAQIEECPSTPAICDDLATALSRARFEPARRGAEPLAARVSMRFVLAEEAAEAATEETPAAGATEERIANAESEEQAYGATATVVRPPAGALRLTLEEARELPGAFGDPFRAVEALPGVTPVFSGLPYFYVRGAPPSGSLYTYDSISLPLLFHLGLGPSVIHPRMVGPLRLYSGGAPARFGRFIGGVIEAEGPEPVEDSVMGEVDLRLLDVNAFLKAPVGRGELMVAGRYGYPGILASAISPGTRLSYWDYQLRFRYPLGLRTDFELVGLGSFDRLVTTNSETHPVTGERTEEENVLGIQFHRVEARLVHRFHRGAHELEYGMALRFGWDESFLDQGLLQEVSIQSTTLGPRIWLAGKRSGLRYRVGAEFFGAVGHIGTGSLADDADMVAMDPEANPLLASVAGRSLGAVYTELTWDPSRWVTYDIGFRSDLWMTGGTAELALDPRLRATFHATPELDLHVALGVTRQPAVFFVPLPGLADVAVARGPQVAVQSEVGFTIALLDQLDLEAQVFLHRYTGLLFLDLFLDSRACLDNGTACRTLDVPDRVSGLSYGGEVFLRADPELPVSGFLSYTLSKAQIDALPGIDYTPSYDVRHVLNVAGRAQLIQDRLSIGARLHVRTGKPVGVTYLSLPDRTLARYEQRLPTFYRIDAEIAYQWATRWGRFRLSLEWLNVTFSKEPVDLDCGSALGVPTPPCPVNRGPALVLPNLGLRATF